MHKLYFVFQCFSRVSVHKASQDFSPLDLYARRRIEKICFSYKTGGLSCRLRLCSQWRCEAARKACMRSHGGCECMARRRLKRGTQPSRVHQWASREAATTTTLRVVQLRNTTWSRRQTVQVADKPTHNRHSVCCTTTTMGRPHPPSSLKMHRYKHEGSRQFLHVFPSPTCSAIVHFCFCFWNKRIKVRESLKVKPKLHKTSISLLASGIYSYIHVSADTYQRYALYLYNVQVNNV